MDSSNTSLRRFDFRYLDSGSLAQTLELNLFLNLAGPQLLHFGSSIPGNLQISKSCKIGASLSIALYPYDVAGPHPALNISPCIHLRSLTLYIKMLPPSPYTPRPNERPWAYLLAALDGLPFKGSSLVLDLFTLHIRFTLRLMNSQAAARTALVMVIHQIRDLETMVLGWVQSRVLCAVKVQVGRPLTSADASWMQSELFPRLYDTGALSLENQD